MNGPRVVSVNVGAVRRVEWEGEIVSTGIWKSPAPGRVALRGVNFAGDDQADRTVHGGPHKAVYAYAQEDYDFWRDEHGIETQPGLFGENLTLEGIDLSAAIAGERWRVGSCILEIAQPRLPCYKLGMRMHDPHFPRRFQAAMRMGAYLRVIEEGAVGANDPITIVDRPTHGVTLDTMVGALHDLSKARALRAVAVLPGFWQKIALAPLTVEHRRRCASWISNNRPLTLPDTLTTARLVLRRWQPSDAAKLEPILASNWDHLGPWIPIHVAKPAPKAALEARLAGFATEFDADLKWRYGMFSSDEGELLGEVDMFPRDADGRVAYPESDRVEIGYWVRSDLTGRGYVTEGVRRMLDLAASLPRVEHIEIRCDARNKPSAAIPAKLGFVLAATLREHSPAFKDPDAELQVWSLEIAKYRSMRDND